MKLVEHLEGETKLLVPAASLTQEPPPTSPVFFNPAASLNRDLSVAITSAAGGKTFCDSMAGVGARGLRVANEVAEVERVTLVDFNAQALKAARKAAGLNRVLGKCEFSCSETSSYLFSRYGRERRFDFVDVDPFGTPVRQLPAAIAATSDGGILSVTATDTAVLCGVYPRVSSRRYWATPLNNHFHHETGLRVLAGAVARHAAALEVGVETVAAHATKHYLRLYLRVNVGASKADEALEDMGFVTWCPGCGHASASGDLDERCARCGKKARAAGPLWLGGLTDTKVIERASRAAVDRGLGTASGVASSLEGIDEFPPWSFSVERVCSALKVPTVSEAAVSRCLRERGYAVMRTPFEKTGIKTDAGYEEFAGAVREAARQGPRAT